MDFFIDTIIEYCEENATKVKKQFTWRGQELWPAGTNYKQTLKPENWTQIRAEPLTSPGLFELEYRCENFGDRLQAFIYVKNGKLYDLFILGRPDLSQS